MIQFFKSWILITRAYALPMSVFSWFVAYAYSIIDNGNSTYGLIALAGICLAHLGANMFDDFVDYHLLTKKYDKDNKLKFLNAQRNKCSYITNSIITVNQLLLASLLFLAAACLVGVYLAYKTGIGVYIFMLMGGFLGLVYPLLGKFRLCETAIALIYGPYLFGGVNYVMTGSYDWHTLIVCIPTMLMTVNLLYTDTMLDYDIDSRERKKTIANMFQSKWGGFRFHKILLAAAYLSVFLTAIFDIADWEVFLTWGTIPMALNLLDSMKIYIIDNTTIPEKRGFANFMENWDEIEKDGAEAFMYRMYQARNLMICFSLIFGLTLILYSG